MTEKELIVITGCDSGIGEELCKVFLKNGYSVVASYLSKPPDSILNFGFQISGFKDKKIKTKKQNKFFSYKMDLRKGKDISDFIKFIRGLINKGYKLSCFINNAGIAVFGPVENLPLFVYRDIFEINYFGMVALIKDFIPYLVKSKGKIIIIGSTAGRVAVPFAAPYASSKFAVEGFADSLRREMIPYGIKTLLIEPAGIATPIWKNSWKRVKKKLFPYFDKKYIRIFNKIGKMIVKGSAKGLGQDKCAERIYKIFKKKNPSARYLIAKNYPVEWLNLHLPSSLIDFALPKILGMDYGRKD